MDLADPARYLDGQMDEVGEPGGSVPRTVLVWSPVCPPPLSAADAVLAKLTLLNVSAAAAPVTRRPRRAIALSWRVSWVSAWSLHMPAAPRVPRGTSGHRRDHPIRAFELWY